MKRIMLMTYLFTSGLMVGSESRTLLNHVSRQEVLSAKDDIIAGKAVWFDAGCTHQCDGVFCLLAERLSNQPEFDEPQLNSVIFQSIEEVGNSFHATTDQGARSLSIVKLCFPYIVKVSMSSKSIVNQLPNDCFCVTESELAQFIRKPRSEKK